MVLGGELLPERQSVALYGQRGLTKMFCVILKHHSWEPEVEVIRSLIVLFILLRI